jgi:phage shock protein A
MALINRVSRLLTADIHAVLDRIEEPEALLRQAIRDMEEELTRAEQHLKRLEHEREALTTRRQKLDASLRDVDAQLDVCFDAGNEALARKLVKRKLETERFGKHVTERLDAIDKTLAAQRASLVGQREHLDVMRQKAEVLTENSQPAAKSFGDDATASHFAVGDDEVEVAFLRERQRRKPS